MHFIVLAQALLMVLQRHATGAIYKTGNVFQTTTKGAIYPRVKCGRTITNTNEGVIESPGYPLKYKSNLRCDWLIQSPHKSDVIYVNFIDLDVEESSLCLFDYVSLTFEGSRPQRFCGYETPSNQPIIVENSGWIRIKFLTDGSVEKSGFRIAFKIEKRSSEEMPILLPQTQQHRYTPLPESTSDKLSTNYDSLRFKEFFRFASSLKMPNSTDEGSRTTDKSKTTLSRCQLPNVDQKFNVGDIVRITCSAGEHDAQNSTNITCLPGGQWTESLSCKPFDITGHAKVESQIVLSYWQIAMLIVTGVACTIYVIFTSYLFVAQRRRISQYKCSRCNRQLNYVRGGRHLTNSNYESEECTFA
uniref:CUB and sushi domain-containing protein 2-like n=1 Tax=Styela clava TaxID=7725 RepID=UPI00193A761C|nr:CUB and sushi domain-containing protein 2-like [Styela clava]